MSSRAAMEAVGDFLYGWPFEFYDNVGNYANYAFLTLGFVGLIYWLRLQAKMDKQAENNPDQLR
jgi:hypothetical protein